MTYLLSESHQDSSQKRLHLQQYEPGSRVPSYRSRGSGVYRLGPSRHPRNSVRAGIDGCHPERWTGCVLG
eukprot:476708-Amphidinium_carterae.1